MVHGKIGKASLFSTVKKVENELRPHIMAKPSFLCCGSGDSSHRTFELKVRTEPSVLQTYQGFFKVLCVVLVFSCVDEENIFILNILDLEHLTTFKTATLMPYIRCEQNNGRVT